MLPRHAGYLYDQDNLLGFTYRVGVVLNAHAELRTLRSFVR